VIVVDDNVGAQVDVIEERLNAIVIPDDTINVHLARDSLAPLKQVSDSSKDSFIYDFIFRIGCM